MERSRHKPCKNEKNKSKDITDSRDTSNAEVLHLLFNFFFFFLLKMDFKTNATELISMSDLKVATPSRWHLSKNLVTIRTNEIFPFPAGYDQKFKYVVRKSRQR